MEGQDGMAGPNSTPTALAVAQRSQRPASQTGGAAAARRPINRPRAKEYAKFVAFILPNLALVLTFEYWPVIYNAILSFHRWNFLAPSPTFVGIQNYVDLVSSSKFHTILTTTAIFTVSIVVVTIFLGLALGLLLNMKLRGRGLVRTLAFAPHIVSSAAIATLWLFILDPNYGLIRAILQPLGLSVPDMINGSTSALTAIIIVHIWKAIGFTALLYIAGLQAIPQEVYEAAKLDGANSRVTTMRITIPLLSPTTFFVTVTTIISTFKQYDVIAVMTGGGPGIATTNLSWSIYDLAFRSQDVGHGAATAVVLFIVLLLVTLFQTAVMQRRVHYTS